MQASNNCMLKMEDVASFTGRHPRTIRRWSRSGVFPKPIYILKWAYWMKQDVEQWFEAVNSGLTGEALKARCEEIAANRNVANV